MKRRWPAGLKALVRQMVLTKGSGEIKNYNYIRFDTIKSDGLGITTANLIPQGALDAEIYD
ncbi:hypothetical protein [Harryflintia acetispora]|uniref:hypothetical protein n=1 Tax=Harryflintia acetispora TaxID=1849041 RepID=UPI00189A9131|nr:hypothetical protein [Harryflintia acetispora]